MTPSINIAGELLPISTPLVMAIINITDDSFFSQSCCRTQNQIAHNIASALSEGADIIDIGCCSTRPNSIPVDSHTELARLKLALEVINSDFPNAIVSLDTFRVEIAEYALQYAKNIIINDISGLADSNMIDVLSQTNTPYVLTFNQTLDTKQHITHQAIDFFQNKINILTKAGVKDIIIDPGFGFNKTYSQNWLLFSQLSYLNMLNKPLLVGISRKSMIQHALQCTAQQALNGTTACHILALEQGTNILRVHDVKAAKQAITIYQTCKQTNNYT